MDVSNFGVSAIKRTNESFFKLDKRQGILKKTSLRKDLMRAKQDLIEKRTDDVVISFKTSTKIALAEAYINSGKLYAAEQVLNEVSKMVFELPESSNKQAQEEARISPSKELDKKALSANNATLKEATEEKPLSTLSNDKLKEYLILNEIKDKTPIE
ncbi:MAG: hypothetical protein IEMM0008_1282 [bacterium]|nr:MAG: hypothetical protein IEMM0008_1282 [bacterium]